MKQKVHTPDIPLQDTKEVTRYGADLQKRYEKYRGILKNLTIMSDVLMRNVFNKRECVEYVLQVIMGREDLRVIEQVIQKDYKNLQGRSAILDCVVRAAGGEQYNVEIQQDTEGAMPRRARYHSGLMNMNTLEAGQDFEELPDSYVIFITKEDALGYGLSRYHIGRVIEEVRAGFQDGSHILYVNSKVQDDTELGRLMHDLHCREASEIYSPILAERIRELKETQEGVDIMCREMDRIYSEGMEAGEKLGMKLGELKARQEMTRALAAMGISAEKIARAAKASPEVIQEWLARN